MQAYSFAPTLERQNWQQPMAVSILADWAGQRQFFPQLAALTDLGYQVGLDKPRWLGNLPSGRCNLALPSCCMPNPLTLCIKVDPVDQAVFVPVGARVLGEKGCANVESRGISQNSGTFRGPDGAPMGQDGPHAKKAS